MLSPQNQRVDYGYGAWGYVNTDGSSYYDDGQGYTRYEHPDPAKCWEKRRGPLDTQCESDAGPDFGDLPPPYSERDPHHTTSRFPSAEHSPTPIVPPMHVDSRHGGRQDTVHGEASPMRTPSRLKSTATNSKPVAPARKTAPSKEPSPVKKAPPTKKQTARKTVTKKAASSTDAKQKKPAVAKATKKATAPNPSPRKAEQREQSSTTTTTTTTMTTTTTTKASKSKFSSLPVVGGRVTKSAPKKKAAPKKK